MNNLKMVTLQIGFVISNLVFVREIENDDRIKQILLINIRHLYNVLKYYGDKNGFDKVKKELSWMEHELEGTLDGKPKS